MQTIKTINYRVISEYDRGRTTRVKHLLPTNRFHLSEILPDINMPVRAKKSPLIRRGVCWCVGAFFVIAVVVVSFFTTL